MAQFGLLNNGIRVRDPSQMFMFGDTNWGHESLTKNKSQQAWFFSKPLLGNKSTGSVDQNLCKKEGENQTAVAEASSSDEKQPCFGLTLTSKSQTLPVSCFDPFQIGKQMVKKEEGCFKKPSQSPKSVNNQVSVKKEDGQLWSTRPPNLWLCSPLQQNKQNLSVTGSCELPSTSRAANNRIRNLSNTPSLKSNKRKFSSFERLQWHKEVTEGSSRFLDISTAEVEWAKSVARLPEKLKDLGDEIAESHWIINRKRRLSLTTQLMQLLFKPPPAIVLSEDAVAHCDVVTYYASKLALDDAFSLCSPAGKNMKSKSNGDQDLLQVIEGFIDRSKRLQDDILRLEKKRSLILEVMMDFQDLERFSFINRFAKFHSRRPMVKRDTASSAARKPYPQRYVKVIPMPTRVPEGQNCILL